MEEDLLRSFNQLSKETNVIYHNYAAERSVLGSVMLRKEALFDVLELLAPEDFYSREQNYREISK